jgi:hypothetical protein
MCVCVCGYSVDKEYQYCIRIWCPLSGPVYRQRSREEEKSFLWYVSQISCCDSVNGPKCHGWASFLLRLGDWKLEMDSIGSGHPSNTGSLSTNVRLSPQCMTDKNGVKQAFSKKFTGEICYDVDVFINIA